LCIRKPREPRLLRGNGCDKRHRKKIKINYEAEFSIDVEG
jgi:hypothetical protein